MGAAKLPQAIPLKNDVAVIAASKLNKAALIEAANNSSELEEEDESIPDTVRSNMIYPPGLELL